MHKVLECQNAVHIVVRALKEKQAISKKVKWKIYVERKDITRSLEDTNFIFECCISHIIYFTKFNINLVLERGFSTQQAILEITDSLNMAIDNR